MTAPLPPVRPLPGPTTGPNLDDPTGLRYDRADDSTTVKAGDGWPLTGRGVRTKQCCGFVLVGEVCDCATIRRQLRNAPVIVMPAFNLRQLAAQHTTAAAVDQQRRAA